MNDAMNDLIEQIAAVQHEIWVHWMRFLFACGELRQDGSVVIPPEKVARWQSQMDRAYSDLSESEKASDRDQALKVMQVIQSIPPEGLTEPVTDAVTDVEPPNEDEPDDLEEDADARDRT
jgi:hypothetical protein